MVLPSSSGWRCGRLTTREWPIPAGDLEARACLGPHPPAARALAWRRAADRATCCASAHASPARGRSNPRAQRALRELDSVFPGARSCSSSAKHFERARRLGGDWHFGDGRRARATVPVATYSNIPPTVGRTGGIMIANQVAPNTSTSQAHDCPGGNTIWLQRKPVEIQRKPVEILYGSTMPGHSQ